MAGSVMEAVAPADFQDVMAGAAPASDSTFVQASYILVHLMSGDLGR